MVKQPHTKAPIIQTSITGKDEPHTHTLVTITTILMNLWAAKHNTNSNRLLADHLGQAYSFSSKVLSLLTNLTLTCTSLNTLP